MEPHRLDRKSRALGRTMRESAVGLVLALVVTLLPGASAATENVDLKRGQLGHLFPMIRSYQYETVLGDPIIASAIDRMLGPMATLLPNSFQVRVPIDFVGGALVLHGSAPHEEGALEAAEVWVDLRNGFVAVAQKHERAVTVYTEHPWESTWIFGFRDQARDMAAPRKRQPLPETFTWIHRGQLRDIAEF